MNQTSFERSPVVRDEILPPESKISYYLRLDPLYQKTKTIILIKYSINI